MFLLKQIFTPEVAVAAEVCIDQHTSKLHCKTVSSVQVYIPQFIE
jgi:hypothetical protein